MNTLKELYAYREMIASLVRRDLKGRYKGSVLGFLWTFLNPLFQLGVYTLVFSTIMRSGIKDFYLFLFVALVPWIFLSTSVTGGAACVWAQQDMIKKIYFPRETLPLAYVTSQLVNMLLSLIVVLVVLIVSGKGISAAALAYLPLVIVIEYVCFSNGLFDISNNSLLKGSRIFIRNYNNGVAVYDTYYVFN